MFWKLVIISLVAFTILKWTPRKVDDVVLFFILVIAAILVYMIMNIFEHRLHRRDNQAIEEARRKAGLKMRFKI